MAWEVVVGIETHAQLLTKSKMFSGAPNAFGAEPNCNASALDIALPGTLPVANRAAVEHAIRFGLAVKGRISARSIFARKNYFYPDLPKGYQISQYETPVVQGGELSFFVDGEVKTLRLTRAHLEEDAGKSLHELQSSHAVLGGSHAALGHGMSGIDLNRAGTPLLEIVTEPELRGAKEAVAYARALHALVMWIGICDGNMQEGSFRCDANVSVRKAGQDVLGTRCEIKNLNSFRFMEQAIEFEARRQIELIEDGKAVVQETRLYDPERNETRSMRSKEDAQDYRYFPDPDLLPLVIAPAWVAEIAAAMPELPAAKRARFAAEYALSQYDANLLTASREVAGYFEAVAKQADPKLAANWVNGELASRLNDANLPIADAPVPPDLLAWMLGHISKGTISGKIAKEKVFPDLWEGKRTGLHAGDLAALEAYIQGHAQISDAGAIEKAVDEVLAANVKQVEDYRAGKEKAFNSLVGQVMKATAGKANPAQVSETLRRKLGAR